MANEKYEFVPGDEKVIAPGRTVKRIRALVAISYFVAAGDIGGYIESEASLPVYGDAWVYGNARVYGDAQVYGDADFLLCGPIGSRRAFLTVTADAKIKIRYSTGCFSGSLAELQKSIKETHGTNEYAKQYKAAISLAKLTVRAKDGKE